LKWCKPNIFLAVPRIYEKIEERLREAEANAGSIGKGLMQWAR
jgi:long-subunit acyl-CoA synthetase (AMP-forming)